MIAAARDKIITVFLIKSEVSDTEPGKGNEPWFEPPQLNDHPSVPVPRFPHHRKTEGILHVKVISCELLKGLLSQIQL